MTLYISTPDGNISLTKQEEESLLKEWAENEKNKQLNLYKDLRAKEYPNIIEYIDGVVKNDQAQIQAYIDACLAVKAKYPKP